jgi:hypothetical protein
MCEILGFRTSKTNYTVVKIRQICKFVDKWGIKI